MFVAFGQSNAVAQAIGFFILDLMFLVAVAIIRPYMDKTTNGSYISIASVNWFNSLTLLLFSGIFGVPVSVSIVLLWNSSAILLILYKPLGIGIMGVLYFLVNVVFTAVILFMTIWAAGSALFMKNPDGRYQPMLDDRGSFVKSQTNLETTELDALGATARGESRVGDVYSRGGFPPYSGYGRHNEGSLHSGFGHHDGGSVASGIDSYSRFGEKRVGGVRNYDAEWTPGRADGPSPSPLLGRR
jgi:hypothetical protein